jgi:hypothetical protein
LFVESLERLFRVVLDWLQVLVTFYVPAQVVLTAVQLYSSSATFV